MELTRANHYQKTLKSYMSEDIAKLYEGLLFAERRYPLRKEFTSFLDLLPKRAKILDIGSGTGKDVDFMIYEGFNAQGIDASEAMIKIARSNFGNYFSRLDIRSLDVLSAHSFAGVTAIASIQHISKKDINSVIKSIHHILEPGGLFFIFTKRGNGYEWDTRLGRDHARGTFFYELSELQELLLKNNFTMLNDSIFDLTRYGRTDKWLTTLAQSY